MFQLDDKFLEETGLNLLPEEQKKPFLQHIYDELELRVGTKLSSGMTDEQLREFEAIIDRKDDVIQTWLSSNVPDYTNDVIFQQLQSSTGLDINNLNLKADYAATKWLELNRSDYRQVVAEVLNGLKTELIANKNMILGN